MLISLDTETSGVDLRHGAQVYFLTICDENENISYWEWNVDPLTRKVDFHLKDIKEIGILLDKAKNIVIQNARFDIAALKTISLETDREDWAKIHDTLFSSHLLASNQPKDLTTLALIYLGINIKPYEDKLERACKEARTLAKSKFPKWRLAQCGDPTMPSAKESVWKFDGWLPRRLAIELDYPEDHPWWTVLSEYSNIDSSVTLPLFKVQRDKLKERGLWEIYLDRIKILPVVFGMEHYGITASGEEMERSQEEYAEESATAANVCRNIALDYGVKLELPKSGNNKSLTEFVFNKLKLEPVRESKKTGNPSLDKTAIDHYEATLPANSKQLSFIKNLKNKRKRDTALAYMESYRKFWLPTEDEGWYKLHPSLNPVGTDTLRCSSQNPNAQNISKQEGFNLRKIFGPAPGREWWSLDYQNIELRIPAYESGEKVMIEVLEKPNDPPYFGSYHLVNASIVYPELFWPLAEQKGAFKKKYNATYYQWIKNFSFACSYGAVPESGTADRAAHKAGAQLMVINNLKEHSKLNKKWIDYANKYGYVETLPDKEVDPEHGYPLLCTRSKWGKVLQTVPLSYHIQGTACWVIIRAMVKVQEYLDTLKDCRLVIQVHDELVLDFPVGKGKEPWKTNLIKLRKVQKIMESMGDCIGIPLTTSCEYHQHNWSEGLSV